MHGDPSEVLNGVTAPDSYTALASIQGTPIRRFLVDVVNQAIYWQLQRHNTWEEASEVMMSPGSRAIIRPGMTGIRFRAVTLSANLPVGRPQAVVTIEAVK